MERLPDFELEQLLCGGESERVERKRQVGNDKEDIRHDICAFSNDLPGRRQPGIVFVGVNNDGSCANLAITDALLRELADMRSDGNILPLPVMTVEKRRLLACDLAVVTVYPHDSPPVRCRGRVWIRIGTRRGTASDQEERTLIEKRRFRDQPFDLRPIGTSALDDLDVEMFQREYLPTAIAAEVLDANSRTVEQQLASVRFATVTEPFQPTVTGVLVVGRDPQGHLPGAYIQFLRLDGDDLASPIRDEKRIDGPLPQMLRSLHVTFRAHIATAVSVTGAPTDSRTPDYPIEALTQLAHNAVLHRGYGGTNAPVRIYWFRDRIEIHSPGGPYGNVNRGNFGQPGVTDYRNPHLAEAMKNLGLVQRFGVGIPRVRQALADNGSPAPEFIVEDTHVVAVVRAR
ncbi:transcriptional regulator [Candidatus Poribacteria bacterium]|nr:transcriptional regulator [Candidatus Poribacteria bacterium]